MATVYRSVRAETDLIEIWSSVASDDPSAADRLLDRIAHACALVATYPRAGKQRDDLAPGLWSDPVGNYFLFYVPRDDGIALARILHWTAEYRWDFYL